MRSERPDPDALLSQIQQEEQRQSQGKLKVFLGASAGVGKTYSMLSEAREQQARGVDVVIGYVETHGRQETQALVEGLEVLPRQEIEYKGVKVPEFDLDAALIRKPKLILVDELAHTNAPGTRHPKRWQDIEELLYAGIDVLTAINIQHLESLNDVVAQITGVQVRETVPDAFLERADSIEVIDIPPEQLRQRLREGKVYIPERIEHALEGFFQTGNLIALRELALRRTADSVDAQMQSYRAERGLEDLWPVRDRILVCVAPNKMATRVVRAAARIGTASHAEMLAISVESDRQANRSTEDRTHAMEALQLAETLGMQTFSITGHDIVREVLQYAHQRNISLIVVGKPVKARWKEILFGSVVDELVRQSGSIDVHVLTMFEDDAAPRKRVHQQVSKGSPTGYVATLVVTAVATGICQILYERFDLSNLVMVYLLGVALISSRYGIREAVLASVLGVGAFDFIFVHPRWTLAVSDSQYIVTFGVMLGVSLLIASLTQRLRVHAETSTERERRTAALYTLSKELAQSRSKREISLVAVKEIRSVFDADSAVFLNDDGLREVAASAGGFERDPSEAAVVNWCFEHNQEAGRDTETLPGSKGLYLPLRGSGTAIGVLAVLPSANVWPLNPAQMNLLETFANSLGLALERTLLAKESQESKLQAESEKLRNALLSSISHDLRTPLTSIAGAASSLYEGKGDTEELASTIYQQSMKLNLQVQNLLDMTRLQSGQIEARLEWHSLEELIGTALQSTSAPLKGRSIDVKIPGNLPLVHVDGELMTKVFTNVLENAAAHTPAGSPIKIDARDGSDRVYLEIADRGPGIPKGEEVSIFDRFARGQTKDNSGFGLGLTICRAIMKLHDGRIWAKNGPEGGAIFVIEVKKSENVPEVPLG